MSEKRFTCKVKKQGDIEYVLFIDTSEEVEYMSFFEIIDLVNKLNDDNEKLRKKINTYESEPFEDGLDDETKISIFNKDKGDWKWNDNNDTIINIRTGEKFYLRNSGAVENLVDLLNEQQATLNKQNEEIINSHIAYVESLNEIKDLKEENEQLRKKNEEYKINWSNSMDIARLNQETTRELHRENEQLRRENKKKDIEIQSLNAHITNWLNETKIAKLYENEQYRTETLEKENEQLRQQLKEKQEDEKEYAREILRLNKLVKEYSEIRQLGGDY